MDVPESLLWFLTMTCLLCSVVTAVRVFWLSDFDSTSIKKRTASIETDITSLNLESERIRAMLKKLSNRHALAEFRERQADGRSEDAPLPQPATKNELRAKFLRGTHTDIARRAMRGEQ